MDESPAGVSRWMRAALLVGSVVLSGLATAGYIGSQFGRGPSDSFMTSLARRTGLSLRLVRSVLELGVVIIGLLLGGALGAGAVVYALVIGTLAQAMLRWFTVKVRRSSPKVPANSSAALRRRRLPRGGRPARCYRSRLDP